MCIRDREGEDEIQMEEIIRAVNKGKKGKSAGLDGVRMEMCRREVEGWRNGCKDYITYVGGVVRYHRIGRMVVWFLCIRAVSYTHLRAHETPEHLVCRLLLEKKKKK